MSVLPFVVPATPTVAEVVGWYLQHLLHRVKADDYSAQAFSDANRDLLRFSKVHGPRAVAALRRHDLTQWLLSNPQWASPSTKARVRAVLLRCFNWAEEEELIEASPFRRVRGQTFHPRPRREAQAVEYVGLMRAGSRSLRRALFFLRRTGARTCEMRELRPDWIDFEAGIVRFDRHKTARATGQPRILGLEPCVLRFLRNILRGPGRGHVFTNARGRPWDRHTFARHFRRLANRIGLAKDLSAYCFRHAYATGAIQAGVGERQLADQLGHTTTRMVAWYAQASRQKADHLRRVAVEALQRRRNVHQT